MPLSKPHHFSFKTHRRQSCVASHSRHLSGWSSHCQNLWRMLCGGKKIALYWLDLSKCFYCDFIEQAVSGSWVYTDLSGARRTQSWQRKRKRKRNLGKHSAITPVHGASEEYHLPVFVALKGFIQLVRSLIIQFKSRRTGDSGIIKRTGPAMLLAI